MSEELNPTLQSPSRPSKMFTVSILAMVCVAIATLLVGLGSLWSGQPRLEGYFDFLYVQLTLDALTTCLHWLIAGMFLPVCLLLTCSVAKKKGYARVFLVITLLTLGIQLLSAVVMLVIAFLPYRSDITNLLQILFRSVSGSRAFSSLYSVLRQLLNMNFSLIGILSLVENLLISLASLLYIGSNVLCCIGFAALSLPQKKK